MKKYLFKFIFVFFWLNGKSQKLELEPNIGFHYTGISYLSENNETDFKKTRPEFEPTIGIGIKYKQKRITHILNVQNLVLGSSFSFRNIYLDKGIIPTFQEHAHSDGINILLLSYHLQKNSRNYHQFVSNSKIKFTYSIGIGVGLNKSKVYYENYLTPYAFSGQVGTNYYNYMIRYSRIGPGVFFIGKTGVDFFNKRQNHFLTVNIFWNQGLKKMEEFNIDYDYGYFNTSYQRTVKDIKLKTRGTTFGLIFGIPIRLLK